jgi:hypothetical protein
VRDARSSEKYHRRRMCRGMRAGSLGMALRARSALRLWIGASGGEGTQAGTPMLPWARGRAWGSDRAKSIIGVPAVLRKRGLEIGNGSADQICLLWSVAFGAEGTPMLPWGPGTCVAFRPSESIIGVPPVLRDEGWKDAYDNLGFIPCSILSKFRATPGEPVPQSLWQDIPHMRKDNRRVFSHLAFNRHFVCLGVLYATVRALFDSVHLPNQNDRFSYVHKFCLIYNSFLLRDWD